MQLDLSVLGPKLGAIAGTVAYYVLEAEANYANQPGTGAAKKAEVIAKVEANIKDLLPTIGGAILDATTLDEQLLGSLIDKLVELLHPFFDTWLPFLKT